MTRRERGQAEAEQSVRDAFALVRKLAGPGVEAKVLAAVRREFTPAPKADGWPKGGNGGGGGGPAVLIRADEYAVAPEVQQGDDPVPAEGERLRATAVEVAAIAGRSPDPHRKATTGALRELRAAGRGLDGLHAWLREIDKLHGTDDTIVQQCEPCADAGIAHDYNEDGDGVYGTIGGLIEQPLYICSTVYKQASRARALPSAAQIQQHSRGKGWRVRAS